MWYVCIFSLCVIIYSVIHLALFKDVLLEGDVVLHLMHRPLSTEGNLAPPEITICHIAFHTGFIPPGPLRLSASQIDLPKQQSWAMSGEFAVDLFLANTNSPVSLAPLESRLDQ